jgi:hypothetical protein
MTGDQQQEIMMADGPSAALLAEHPRRELCRLCGGATTPATVALPRGPGAHEQATPWTIEARTPPCGWRAQLVRWAREDGEERRGHTASGHPVSPSHPWNDERGRKH